MGRHRISLRALRQRIDAYFAKEEAVKSPAGLALAIGVDTAALRNLLDGTDSAAELLGMAMTRLEKEIVENGLRGKSNATMTSFVLKTQFGYRERSGPAREGEVAVELPEELKKYVV